MNHLLTTLECTILAVFELTRNGVGNDLEKTEAEGGDCW